MSTSIFKVTFRAEAEVGVFHLDHQQAHLKYKDTLLFYFCLACPLCIKDLKLFCFNLSWMCIILSHFILKDLNCFAQGTSLTLGL